MINRFLNLNIARKENYQLLILVVAFSALFACAWVEMPALRNGVREGKTFFFIFSSIIFWGVISMLQIFSKKGISIHLSSADILLLLYFIWVLIQHFWVPSSSFKNRDFWCHILMLPAYFQAKHLGKKNDDTPVKLLLFILLLLGSYQVFLGFKQLTGYAYSNHSLFKVTGNFFNPAPYAGYLACIFPLALVAYYYKFQIPNSKFQILNSKAACAAYRFWRHRSGGISNSKDEKSLFKKVLKYVALVLILGILLIIRQTMSRASWLALLTGAGVIYSFRFELKRHVQTVFNSTLKKTILLITVLLLSISALAGIYQLKKDSADGRLFGWKISMQAIFKQPVTGVGFGNFPPTFGKEQATYFEQGKGSQAEFRVAGKGEYAFNEFIKITVEHGITGLLLFLGFLAALIVPGRKACKRKPLAVIALGGISTILTFSMFSYPFSIAPLLLCFFLYAGLLSGLAHKYTKAIIHLEIPLSVARPASLLSIAVLALLANEMKDQYQAMKSWKEAAILKNYKDYTKACEKMSYAKEALSYDGNFLFEYGQALTEAEKHEEAIAVLHKAAVQTSDPYVFNSQGKSYQALKKYKEAEKAYWRAYHLIPHKFYPLYLLGKLYNEWQKPEKAVAVANQLLNKKVKVPSLAIDEMKKEMKKILSKHRRKKASKNS